MNLKKWLTQPKVDLSDARAKMQALQTRRTLGWHLEGDSLIAWVNDFVFWDIRPDGFGEFRLTVNNVATGEFEKVGGFDRYSQAEDYAEIVERRVGR